MNTLKDVYIKLRNDMEFKAEFQKNPIQALKNADLKLSDQELQILLQEKKDPDDGTLGGRINK